MVNTVSYVILPAASAMAPWTWRRTGGRMEIMPDRSMEIKHVDEETISYHALFIFDVIV
jgi:hypothetical protein